MTKLPNGWAEATLRDAVDDYETIDPKASPDEMFTYIDIGAIDNSVKKITAPKEFLGRDAPSRARRVVKTNDVLFSTVRTYLKNVAQVQPELDGQLTSTGICVLRANEAVDPGYLFRWVVSDAFIDEISQAQDGTMYPAVRDDDVLSGPVPLPPLAEQKRIVRKLDTLSARTSNARTHLTAIAKLVEHYRQQVFELAFSGELTHDFRENPSIEDAEGLPRSWRIIELGKIADIQGGIQVGKKRPPGAELVEVPYLRVANVQRGWLNLEEIKVISVTPQEKERLLLESGDVLMNEGGDRDKLGRGWIWRGEVPECIHQNHVFRIRLTDKDFPSEYISHFANAKGQQYFFDEGTQTTNLASISKRKVSALPVPVPPVEEAKEVLRRIEAAFAKIDRLATEAEKALKLTDRLDERILAKAFSGKLVPQDPNDEPASVLLDRLREPRVKTPVASRRRVAKKKEERPMQRSLEEVLAEAGDWLPSQEAFRRCGIADGAETDQIEGLYAELRALDKEGRLQVEAVFDAQGRKQHDKLKINADQ